MLQTFTAVMQLIGVYRELFIKQVVFKPFSLKLLSICLLQFEKHCLGLTIPAQLYLCGYPQNRAENEECRDAIGSLSFGGEREVPKTAAFLKDSDDLPLENAI